MDYNRQLIQIYGNDLDKSACDKLIEIRERTKKNHVEIQCDLFIEEIIVGARERRKILLGGDA